MVKMKVKGHLAGGILLAVVLLLISRPSALGLTQVGLRYLTVHGLDVNDLLVPVGEPVSIEINSIISENVFTTNVLIPHGQISLEDTATTISHLTTRAVKRKSSMSSSLFWARTLFSIRLSIVCTTNHLRCTPAPR